MLRSVLITPASARTPVNVTSVPVAFSMASRIARSGCDIFRDSSSRRASVSSLSPASDLMPCVTLTTGRFSSRRRPMVASSSGVNAITSEPLRRSMLTVASFTSLPASTATTLPSVRRVVPKDSA